MSTTSVPKPWGNLIVVGASCLTAAVLLLANWPAVQATLTVFWETGVPTELIRLLAAIGGCLAFLVLFVKVSDRFEERRRERAELVALRIVVLAILDSSAVDPAVFQAAKAEQWDKVEKKLAAYPRSLVRMELWRYSAYPPPGEGSDGD